MAAIKILVGSVYGNATEVAENSAEQLKGMGHQVTILNDATVDQLNDNDLDVILVVTSTTGEGEIPDNLLDLYLALKDQMPVMPHARFGMIALGDSGYMNFAEAGKMMNELLIELMVEPLGEALFIDACETEDQDEEVEQWIQQWSALL